MKLMVLFITFFLMICISVGISLWVIQRRQEIVSITSLISYSIVFSLLTLMLYASTTQFSALQQWLSDGEQHYQLTKQFAELGGLDGAIIKVKQRLIEQPNDAKGWEILGKLYIAKHDEKQANLAFQYAYRLKKN